MTIAWRTPAATSAEIMVASASEITSALRNIQPGDTLVMANGTWTNQRIQFAASGTADAPITLRAQTPGQVVLNGNSKINISGSHLVVDGLRFEGGALNEGEHLVEFRGSRGSATHSRLTNTAIIGYNPPSIDTRYFWVSLYGQHNRVDHNLFAGQNHSGVTVVVWRPSGAADYHQIDSNYFRDRAPGNGNGFETIRLGDSSQSLSNSYTLVQENLFERVDGEIEMISNKSGGNVFRGNTFRESAGTLTLRHGDGNLVEGNFFLGGNKNQTGGIRVIGEGQTIVNNYIAGVDDRAGGAISISAGVPNSQLNQYFQVKDALIAHNTVIGTMGPAITLDDGLGSSGRTLLAERVTIANNLLTSTGPALFEGNQGVEWIWEGNLAFGGSLGPMAGKAGVSVADPLLQLGADGLWRPSAVSPAIDAAAGDYSGAVSIDMDGQLRTLPFDVGADELAAGAAVRRPLTAADVGPAWLRPSYLAADFNRDGSVDGLDLAHWQANFGASEVVGGDASGDDLVDGDDFLAWQRQFGATGASAAAAAAAIIPEPASAALLIWAVSAPAWRRRFSGRPCPRLSDSHARADAGHSAQCSCQLAGSI